MTFWTTAPQQLIRPQPASSFIQCTDDELDKVLVNEGETQGELQDDVPLVGPGSARAAAAAAERGDDLDGFEDLFGPEEAEREEVQPPRRLGDPVLPSTQEVADHKCTHLPYRSWCKWCVQGRGVGPQHYETGNR